MNSVSEDFINSIQYQYDEMVLMVSIGEGKGKQGLWESSNPDIVESLVEMAKIESVESSNRLEGVVVERSRINEIVLKGAEPRVRPEEEVAGYRDALNWIHSSYKEIEITAETILELHRTIYKYTRTDHAGRWKRKDNVIVERNVGAGEQIVRFRPVQASRTEAAMEALITNYQDAKERNVDGMVLVPLTILDFLCIHPFLDGNGRAARLLMTLLLYKEGFTIGRFVSLERTVESAKEWYYEALQRSSQGWHDTLHDPKPWLRFFWWMMEYSYRDLERRVGLYSSGVGVKTEMVRDWVSRRIGLFATADIMLELPTISRDLIIRVLADLKREGLVELKSRGRKSEWKRTRPQEEFWGRK